VDSDNAKFHQDCENYKVPPPPFSPFLHDTMNHRKGSEVVNQFLQRASCWLLASQLCCQSSFTHDFVQLRSEEGALEVEAKRKRVREIMESAPHSAGEWDIRCDIN